MRMTARRTTLNSDAPWPRLAEANQRVLDHQRKLHRWADAEPDRRFDDLFNLICDPATLVVAWHRVIRNRGARTAGIDAVTREVAERRGMGPFLADLRAGLRGGTFRALPVKQVGIPKRGGKVRYLGIPTLRDRVAQMALKVGARADLRGRVLPVVVRVPARAARPGRHRGDPPLLQAVDLRVGHRG
jgi:RNA-directed DNA polymerase